jgi:GNAT superfamily N-acetyltransferase
MNEAAEKVAVIDVRAAEPADADALIELTRRTVDVCYRPFLGDDEADRLITDGRLEQFVHDGLSGCVVITCDDRPRGYARCEDNLIRLLIIDERWQRRGLGSRLLGEVESRLFLRRARLWTENDARNRAGIAFATRHGWRPVARYLGGFFDSTRLVFEKDRAAAG